MDCDGRLNFMEFTVAMHLIFIAKLGYVLPVDLDPNTILPASVSSNTSCNIHYYHKILLDLGQIFALILVFLLFI